MFKRILPLSCLLAAALFVQSVAAQVNYKSTMPDGKVIYGDKPVPGARKVDQLKAPPPTRGITAPSAKEDTVLKDLERSRAARDAKENRVRAAEDKVSRAEAALAAGKEPKEGERIGIANGGSRLTEGYLERQKQLEQDVAKARAELASVRAEPVAQTTGPKETDVPTSGRSARALRDR